MQIKKETVSEVCVVESEAEDEECLSVPPMVIDTEIQNVPAKSLVDLGAGVNLISAEMVKKRRLHTVPSRPIQSHH